MRVAIYARVSTSHHDQKPEVQVEELRKHCRSRGWQVAEELIDLGYSGGTDQRPGLKRLMAKARSRDIDLVIVTKLDRMARSLRHLIGILDEFSALGVLFVSVHDQIDLTTASGRLMLHIVAAFGEFERALIRERTLAGLAYARSKGKRLGRPPVHNPDAIRRLRLDGCSYREIARRLGAPMGTITRALRGAHNTPPLAPEKNVENSGGRDA